MCIRDRRENYVMNVFPTFTEQYLAFVFSGELSKEESPKLIGMGGPLYIGLGYLIGLLLNTKKFNYIGKPLVQILHILYPRSIKS